MEEGLVKSNHAIYITGLPTTVGQIQLEDICKGVGKIKKIKVYRDAGERAAYLTTRMFMFRRDTQGRRDCRI